MKRDRGYTPLHRACLEGSAQGVEELSRTLDVNAVTLDQRHTSLMMACQLGHIKMAEVLIDQGADLTIRDVEGHTALHWAALKLDQPAMIDLLLDHGAEIDVQTNVGLTPLCYAAIMGYAGNCGTLISRGADRSIYCRHWTAEQLARHYGYTELAKLLKI